MVNKLVVQELRKGISAFTAKMRQADIELPQNQPQALLHDLINSRIPIEVPHQGAHIRAGSDSFSRRGAARIQLKASHDERQ